MLEVICANKRCSKHFYALRKSRLFCSRKCMDKARYDRTPKKPKHIFPEKQCLKCARSFAPIKPTQNFCERGCYTRFYQAKHRKRLNQKACEQRRLDRINDPERIRENNARYRAKPHNREQAAAASRDWHAKNKEAANPRRTVRKQKERNLYPWKGPLDAARRRAKEKNLPFDLTECWADARWSGNCELSGIPFRIGERGNGPKFFAASIDQIKPKQGYTMDNSRFVLWAVNAFKYDGTDQDVFLVAEAITRLREQRDAAAILALPG